MDSISVAVLVRDGCALPGRHWTGLGLLIQCAGTSGQQQLLCSLVDTFVSYTNMRLLGLHRVMLHSVEVWWAELGLVDSTKK
jgi:hypothetical protein